MYKSPGAPSPQADTHEIADFIEMECIRNASISAREVLSSLDLLDDHYYPDGVPEDDELEPKIEDAINEINRRHSFCDSKYPFTLGRHGHVITLDKTVDETIRDIYFFLLLTTRFDMSKQRIQNGIDAALLFEKLSEYVGKHYFGERADSYLFGTASTEKSFSKKIKSLTKFLGEGGDFKNRDGVSPEKNKDDGLDVVVWKSFSDGEVGKLIGFGQCKTGTYWKDNLTILQPDSFCRKWFIDQPAVTPVRLFFISECILRSEWFKHTSDAGILFDRCRIMDYLPPNEEPPFLPDIKAWNKTAMEIVK